VGDLPDTPWSCGDRVMARQPLYWLGDRHFIRDIEFLVASTSRNAFEVMTYGINANIQELLSL
jgi:hypothetical protein